MSFTPGPWVAHLHSDGAYSIKQPGDYDTQPMIASRSNWSHRANESHANAHLIAAAPDLLAACEEMLSCYVPERSNERPRYRAIIKKAKGES